MLGQLSYIHFINTIFVEQSFGPEMSDSEIGSHAPTEATEVLELLASLRVLPQA